MQGPGAVQLRVSRSRCLARVLFALWFIGLLASLTFFLNQFVDLQSLLVWAFAVLAVSGLAWKVWRSAPEGLLRWDGAAWYWSGFKGDAPCTLTLDMDFQSLLIVSVRRPGLRPVRLWLETIVPDKGWMALRCAVVMVTRCHLVERVTDASVPDHKIP